MRIGLRSSWPAVVLALFASPAWAAEPSEGPDGATLALAAKSVVQVIASGCAGEEGDRAGSGFVLGSDGLIVTDLHVVVGCKTLQAKYQGVDQLPASVVRVLKLRDLALLKVDHPPAVPGLQLSSATPQVKDELDVIGFPLGLPAYDSSTLHVTLATETTPELRAALRQQELDQLKSVGFPDLDTQVIRVDGNLLPGHSGAPLIDDKGHVAGVGSGGLERGTVGIGWAIRAQYVADLLNSKETAAPTATNTTPSVAFAMAMPSSGKEDAGVKCGDLSLVKRRRVRLGTLIQSADDPAKLRLMLKDLTATPVAPLDNDRFEIWTEPQSGAGIALPAGLRIESGAQYCTVHTGAAAVTYVISLKPLPMDVNAPAWEVAADRDGWMVVHEALGISGAKELIVDGRYSVGARVENDGIVRRTMSSGAGPDGKVVRVFTSTLTGRGAFISIFVVNRDARPEPASAQPVAMSRQSEEGEQETLAWTRGLLAVNFAAFPPSAPIETQAQGQADRDQSDDIVLPGARPYPRIRCGDLSVIPFTQSRPLSDLTAAKPMPPDLAALLQSEAEIRPAQIMGDLYDEWVQPTRGATVFLPHGAALVPDPHGCHIASGNPDIGYTLRMVRNKLGDTQDGTRPIETETQEFLRDLARSAGIAEPPENLAPIFESEIAPSGKVVGFLLRGTRPGGAHALVYVVRLRRDSAVTFFALTDLKVGGPGGSAAGRPALAQGLAAIRLSTLMP